MEASHQSKKHVQHGGQLGPLLCWAVVFADIGSSIYYVPGILYGKVGNLAGFFVLLTMSVFVLLALKYAEVSARFPEGGGVVTVAAQAMNPWIGALGGMFILVSYFLTAAISCLSAIQYFSVVAPAIGPFILEITIGVLMFLGLLNWIGISESAKVSLIGALIAFVSDLAIIWTVFTHISLSEFPALFGSMFAHASLTPVSLLVGFASAFLAFSGLESISQLSPVMKSPRKKVISLALLFVVITIGVTSPLLTILSTLLQQKEAADPVVSTQLISLLGGHWGNTALQTEVAISASLILAFASNTAVIGAYHVFMALSRMEFLPRFILKRNKFRNTPHWSIILATGIPIVVLIVVHGAIDVLGDMYAFGLLGAFSVTCLGLDILRSRELRLARAARIAAPEMVKPSNGNGNGHLPSSLEQERVVDPSLRAYISGENGHLPLPGTKRPGNHNSTNPFSIGQWLWNGWVHFDYWLGIATTILVILAWLISLVSKPLATAFGGTVATIGMVFAYLNYVRGKGHMPVVTTSLRERLPNALLAVLVANDENNDSVISAVISHAHGKLVVFLYLAEPGKRAAPQLFEVVDPYLEDQSAKNTFKQAALLAHESKLPTRFVYQQQEPGTIVNMWQKIRPHAMVLAADRTTQCEQLSPDYIRFELTPQGKVAHLLKSW